MSTKNHLFYCWNVNSATIRCEALYLLAFWLKDERVALSHQTPSPAEFVKFQVTLSTQLSYSKSESSKCVYFPVIIGRTFSLFGRRYTTLFKLFAAVFKFVP